MVLRVQKKEFLNALSVGGSVAGQSKVMSILDCVKVVVDGGIMCISSYDMETMVSTTMNVECVGVGKGSFCAPIKDILSSVKSVSDEVFDIVVDNNMLRIVHSKGQIEFPCQSAEEFPVPVSNYPDSAVTVKSSVLFDIIGSARSFVANDPVRLVLCGISIKLQRGLIEFAATDCRVLFVDKVKCEYNGTECSAIIPVKAINSIMGVINGTDEATIMVGSDNVTVTSENGSVKTRCIEGKFPNYNDVIPQNCPNTAEVDKNELVSSIRRVMVSSNASTKAVSFHFEGVSIEMKSEDFDMCKKANDICLCSYAGEPVTIGLSSQILLNSLASVKSQNVLMRLTDGTRPMLIGDAENKNRTILIMPIRIV